MWWVVFVWACALHQVHAVLTPVDKTALEAAVGACLLETPDGSCPTFAAKDGNGVIGAWSVSKVTNMNRLFSGIAEFNADISSWDVSNVVDFGFMFAAQEAKPRDSEFNGDLSKWYVFFL